MTAKEPRLNDKFIMSIKGKDFVLYSGLLDLAHQHGIKSINVEPVQFPTKDNGMEAICRVVVISADGQEFTEIGDANPRNVNVLVKEHVLRMAATRAKARAFRDLTNIGMTCLEELGDVDPVYQSETKPEASKTSGNKEKKQESDNKNSGKESSDAVRKKTGSEKKTGKAPDPEKEKEETGSGKGAEEPRKDAGISIAQKNAIMSLAKRRSIDTEEISGMVEQIFNRSSLDYLSASEASAFIRQLQQAA